MVDFLLTLDNNRYDKFCTCLERTGQGHIVQAYLKVTKIQPDQGATGTSSQGESCLLFMHDPVNDKTSKEGIFDG